MSVPVLSAPKAVAVAAELAERLAKGSVERDRERVLPADELDLLSASGLLAVTVPAALGGADLDVETLTEVVRLLATGDHDLLARLEARVVVSWGDPPATTRAGRSVDDGTRYGIRASLILLLARVMRRPMAASWTRKARAISATVRPPTRRSVSAIRASIASAG